MWGDVIIGTGYKGACATHVFEIPGEHSISQNRVSFWTSDCILGIGMTIFKDTPEGKQLQVMIDDKVPLENIEEYLDTLILRNIDIEIFKKHLEKYTENHFRIGQEAKINEILKVLHIG